MSQQSLLEIEYTKKIQAAAVNQAVTQLVAAKKGLSETSKRLSKNKDYDAAISSLQRFGVEMSRVALQQRVTRAIRQSGLQEVIEELNLVNSPTTDVSSLSSFSTETETTQPATTESTPEESTRPTLHA